MNDNHKNFVDVCKKNRKDHISYGQYMTKQYVKDHPMKHLALKDLEERRKESLKSLKEQ